MRAPHALRALALVLLAPLVLAPSRARADDEDDKTYELKIVARAKKGGEETVEIEANVERPGQRGGVSGETLKATYKRRVRAVDEDGLPSREVLTVDKADLESYEASPDGSSSRSSTGNGGNGIVLTIDRSGRARRASGVGGDKLPQLPGVSNQLMDVLKRDPDGVASLVQPDEAMSPGDEWNVNRADLLALFGPARTKLVKKGSRAAARLVSVDSKAKDHEARIELGATLFYVEKDADESAEPTRMKIVVKLACSIDGSAPPRLEETSITTRDPKGAKETARVKMIRTRLDSDDDPDKSEKKKPDADDDDEDDKKPSKKDAPKDAKKKPEAEPKKSSPEKPKGAVPEPKKDE